MLISCRQLTFSDLDTLLAQAGCRGKARGAGGNTLGDSVMDEIVFATIMGQGIASADTDVDVPAVLWQEDDKT